LLVDAIVAVLVRASPYDAESWILVGLVLGPLVAALIMLVGYFRLRGRSR
jgi:hypothetical protein